VQPYGVAVDSKGKIYVADTYVGAIFVFDLNKEINQAGSQSLTPVTMIANGKDAQFRGLIGVAIDDNDRLFAVDVLLRTISVFDANHKFETSFGSDVLGQPNCVAIDTENRFLYVTDAAKNHVAVFDADTYKLLRTVGGPPKKEGDDEPGTFARPTYVAVDHEGSVYVSDTINNRIQIFDADGQFVSTFGKAGDRPGFFSRPKGVAVDGDGHVWVVDSAQDNVQIYNRSGQLLAFFGDHGPFPGEFILPTGLTIDKQNRVIVAEQHFPGRLQVFRYVTDAEVAAEKSKEGKSGEKPLAIPAEQSAKPPGEVRN
jgi:DNA-binding beta-propeller fold protein YncE